MPRSHELQHSAVGAAACSRDRDGASHSVCVGVCEVNL